MASPFPDHVYVGYWVREKGDELICEPFSVKAQSFKKARHEVETETIVEFSLHASGVMAMFYLQRKPHELIAYKNVAAFFAGPSEKDVHIGDVIPTSKDASKVILPPRNHGC